MNTPSRLSNLSMHSVNTTSSHNVERISALAEKLNQIQVNKLFIKNIPKIKKITPKLIKYLKIKKLPIFLHQ